MEEILHDFVMSIWLIHIFYNENFVLKMDTLEANEGRLCLSGAIHPPLLWTTLNQFQNHFGTGLCQLHSQDQKMVMLGHNCIRRYSKIVSCKLGGVCHHLCSKCEGVT